MDSPSRDHAPSDSSSRADSGAVQIVNHCHGDRDGDCSWADCPQLRDNEPHQTGRHCPLDNGCPRCGYEIEDCTC